MGSVPIQCMLYKLTSLLYFNTFVPLLVRHWLMKSEVVRKGQFPSYLKVNITVPYGKCPGALAQISKESQMIIINCILTMKSGTIKMAPFFFVFICFTHFVIFFLIFIL